MIQIKNLGHFRTELSEILKSIDDHMEVLPSPQNKGEELIRNPGAIDFIDAGWRNPAGGYRNNFITVVLFDNGKVVVEYRNTHNKPNTFLKKESYDSLQKCFDDRRSMVSYLIT